MSALYLIAGAALTAFIVQLVYYVGHTKGGGIR